jgi:hypothetical protein
MTYKIRSVWGPLIKDHEKGLRIEGLREDWKVFGIFGFWGNGSEKGYTRKTIGNRVAR